MNIAISELEDFLTREGFRVHSWNRGLSARKMIKHGFVDVDLIINGSTAKYFVSANIYCIDEYEDPFYDEDEECFRIDSDEIEREYEERIEEILRRHGYVPKKEF